MSSTPPIPPPLRKMPTQVATTFPLFPNLAPELRLKVWAHACFPRIVSIRYLPILDKCVSSSSPPALLQVCHEAREEALQIYSLAFGTRFTSPRIYFNPYRDTLYLPRHMAMGYDETLRDFSSLVVDREGLLNEVRRIAIDHVDIEVKRPWESYNKASLIRGFKKLEELVLVLSQKGAEAGNFASEVKFLEPRERIEDVLRFWVDFKQTFLLEEKGLEEICRELGRRYEKFVLPSVKIRDKVLM